MIKESSDEESEEEKIVVHTISAADRKGKTDWTMDLPKIQYSAADDEDDSSLSNDGDIDSDNSEIGEKRIQDDDSDNSDFEASSIANVEKKYLK